MEIDLIGLLEGRTGVIRGDGPSRPGPRINGVVVGVVTDINDRQGLGRVRVIFPTVAEQTQSAWARVVVPWAGSDGRGAYFLPAVDDEVLIAFRDGDPGHPYVLGFLWSATAPPPQTSPLASTIELRSASGHSLRMVDTPGAGQLTLTTSGGYSIRLKDPSGSGSITLTDRTGQLSVVLDSASGAITLSAPSTITLSAPNVQLGASSTGGAGDFPSGTGSTAVA